VFFVWCSPLFAECMETEWLQRLKDLLRENEFTLGTFDLENALVRK
jgi:hypothetical protein